MANEINLTQDTGLTLTAKVYTLAGVQQGSTVNLTEVATGLYSGNFSLTGVSDGRYTVLFFNSAVVVGFGNLYVVDESEVDLHKLETRLQSIAEHDATQATLANKLDSSAYTAPDNAGITAIKAKTDNLPSDPADQSLLIAAIGTPMQAGSYVAPANSDISAIKAKTDNLPSDPADQSLIIAAIDAVPTTGEIRTELATELAQIAAIKAKTDNLPSNTTTTLSTLQTSVNNIPTTPLLSADARLNNLDATISSRSTFDPSADPVINA